VNYVSSDQLKRSREQSNGKKTLGSFTVPTGTNRGPPKLDGMLTALLFSSMPQIFDFIAYGISNGGQSEVKMNHVLSLSFVLVYFRILDQKCIKNCIKPMFRDGCTR
jgi:hypothetical protein